VAKTDIHPLQYPITISDEVLEAMALASWPTFEVLGLGLGQEVHCLGLEPQVVGLGLGGSAS